MKHRFTMILMAIIFSGSGIFSLYAYGAPPGFHTKYDGKNYQVDILLDDESILTSPAEGLWSIATEWKNGWPAAWIHSKPMEIEHIGDWTILRGKLETSTGTWRLSDSYLHQSNVINSIHRFFWQRKGTVKFVTRDWRVNLGLKSRKGKKL